MYEAITNLRVHGAPRSKAREPSARLGAQFAPVPHLGHGVSPRRNAIVHGENLAVLGSLNSTLREQVRCVYIDPPYNNQERYNHYSDRQSHDAWLADVRARLEALRSLLASSGSIWISIDDRQVHYLKVTADDVFGRENFVTTIVWQMRTTRENRKVFSNDHEYILVYARDIAVFRRSRNLLPATDELANRYRNPDNDPRGPWQSISANVQAGHATPTQFYPLVAPNGVVHHPPNGRCWSYTRERMQREIAAGNVWFGRDGNGAPRIKKFLRESIIGLTPNTLWDALAVGTSDEAKKEILRLFPNQTVFDTPKPERLLARIIQIATDPGDLVLDAYLGSGTTAAVAHKLGRRYVGIEQNGSAIELCTQRLRQVVDRSDGGGICYGDECTRDGFDVFRFQAGARRAS